MIETILSTVLSSHLSYLQPSLTATSSAPQVVFTRVLPQENYVSYVVEKNDTLKSISLVYFGSEDYWTTLWDDNPSITNPDKLAQGEMIKITVQKPTKPETLSSPLAQKENQLNKNSQTQLVQVAYSLQESSPNTVIPQVSLNPVPASPISDGAISYLGNCEAGMDPAKNTGNGYYGAFQFSYGTWQSMNTGYPRADLAPITVQINAVKQLLQRSSIYNQFPACAQKMHTAGII